MIGSKIMKSRHAISAVLLITFGFFSTARCSERRTDQVASSGMFDASPTAATVRFVGVPKFIGSSDYERQHCLISSVCLHPVAWQIYEVTGYLAGHTDEMIVIRVAHRFGETLDTTAPWLTSLQVPADSLKSALDVDYILVGLELGFNVFCPRGESAEVFRGIKPDFKAGKAGCFSL